MNIRSIALGRTTLLGVAVTVVAFLGLVLGGDGLLSEDQRAEAQTATRPNFVFVMTDDLDERSVRDLPGVRNLMGSNGATFNNAYVTYSLCCPSRATVLRGQYPHNHGILDNSPPLGGEAKFRSLGRDRSTVATWLNDAGYQTKYVGKYMNGYDGRYVPPGWDEWFVLKVANDVVNDNGRNFTLTGNSTDRFADETSDFIRRSSASPAPFFALVGTKAPHTPPEVATRHQDAFATTPLPRPPNFNEPDVSDKPAWVQSYAPRSQTAIADMEQEYRGRLRSMLAVEDLLRQTVDTLRETGELQNTYIVLTSDNGFHFANHRLPVGKRTPYEEDTGIPLIVRGPGVPAGAVRDQFVLNNDFAPTIADLAGAPTPAFVDGRSFAPLLTGSPPSSWRTAFLNENWYPESGGSLPVPTHKSVHTQRYMFTDYDASNEHELYDLVADPYQLESAPRAGNDQLYSELQARLNSLRDCTGAGCRAAEWGDDVAPPPSSPDTASPSVTSTAPGANATGVLPKTNVTATFSEDMDRGTINSETFKLFENGSATRLPAAIGYSASMDTATIDPAASLRTGVTYKAVVTTGAKDLAGNPLDQQNTTTGLQPKEWSFTVRK